MKQPAKSKSMGTVGKTEFHIESDIPMPTTLAEHGVAVDLMQGMKIGDSLVIPANLISSFRSNAPTAHIRIATRSINLTHRRIWRIA